jgi:hypothetical protein
LLWRGGGNVVVLILLWLLRLFHPVFFPVVVVLGCWIHLSIRRSPVTLVYSEMLIEIITSREPFVAARFVTSIWLLERMKRSLMSFQMLRTTEPFLATEDITDEDLGRIRF